MNEYEITYLISGKAGDEARDTLNAEVEKQVGDMEGKISHASAALRRQLAGAVKKERTAFVRTLQVALDPSRITDLHRFLTKQDNVLRFSILNTPRREELSADVVRSLSEEQPKKTTARKPAKKMTDEEVEKGIEEALSEEIK